MTVMFEATVICNLCGSVGAVLYTPSPADARSEVQRVGWTRDGKLDVCPDHSEDSDTFPVVMVRAA